MENKKTNDIITQETAELIYGTRAVFLGPTNHGKSTLIGYMYAESQKINIREHIKDLQKINYDMSDVTPYVFSSLVNPLNKVVQSVSAYGGRYNTFRYGISDFVLKNDKDFPVLVNLIDTPGFNKKAVGNTQRNRLANQEYGIFKANIAIFCINVNDINYKNKDGSEFEEMYKMWQAFHPLEKGIIALTQFDTVQYKESEYWEAVSRITDSIPESRIADFIPVAVDFEKLKGINILSSDPKIIEWYEGPTLQEAIRIQHCEVMSRIKPFNPARQLVFSIDREIPNPKSNAGKVWKIFIENGVLRQCDEIIMTSVNVTNHIPKTVQAQIREFRLKTYINSDMDISYAPKGAIVTIDLRNCLINRKHYDKKKINKSDHSIGFAKNVQIDYYNILEIKLDDALTIDSFSINQQAMLFVFGRSVISTIIDKNENEGIIFVMLQDTQIARPLDEDMKRLDIFKDVVIRISGKNNEYFRGYVRGAQKNDGLKCEINMKYYNLKSERR